MNTLNINTINKKRVIFGKLIKILRLILKLPLFRVKRRFKKEFAQD